jgi:hypothetical protein
MHGTTISKWALVRAMFGATQDERTLALPDGSKLLVCGVELESGGGVCYLVSGYDAANKRQTVFVRAS